MQITTLLTIVSLSFLNTQVLQTVQHTLLSLLRLRLTDLQEIMDRTTHSQTVKCGMVLQVTVQDLTMVLLTIITVVPVATSLRRMKSCTFTITTFTITTLMV